jgi:glutamine---fructose-6-phosphate transaminase (isomerizing)
MILWPSSGLVKIDGKIMTGEPTFMQQEIAEIPKAVGTLLANLPSTLGHAGSRLRTKDPALVATIARGSSDHAAAYLKYAIELSAGIPVASLGPSIASIFQAKLKLDRAAAIAISQSGKSPDIVAMAKSAGEGGALTIALTNTAGSPLAEASDIVVDILAGPERSVAATKTFVTSVVAGLVLLAEWTDDDKLRLALKELPSQLEAARRCDWTSLCEALDGQESLFILGRGPSLAIANEAALKFKETCAVHAEAYSSAEVMHGPVSIVGTGFPVLALIGRDAAETSVAETADQLSAKGARVFATSAKAKAARHLSFVATGHSLTDPLALIVSFYSFIESFARRRGLDPDRPTNLKKVTETR